MRFQRVLREASGRGSSAVVRLVRDPRLAPEMWRKVRYRLTAHLHSVNFAAYSQLTLPALDALSGALRVQHKTVERYMEEQSLRSLLKELEAYEVPVKRMGGAAYLEPAYAIVRIVRPSVVLETGVAHGYSSAVILQALQDNGSGQLYSVDLPAFRIGVPSHTGKAVPDSLRNSKRWHLRLGPDRRVIPQILHNVSAVDIFFYDSDKSYEGMLHTWNLVWPKLRPGGLLVSDDIHMHTAFQEFAAAKEVKPVIIAKPQGQGVYRWERTFLVGILRKPT